MLAITHTETAPSDSVSIHPLPTAITHNETAPSDSVSIHPLPTAPTTLSSWCAIPPLHPTGNDPTTYTLLRTTTTLHRRTHPTHRQLARGTAAGTNPPRGGSDLPPSTFNNIHSNYHTHSHSNPNYNYTNYNSATQLQLQLHQLQLTQLQLPTLLPPPTTTPPSITQLHIKRPIPTTTTTTLIASSPSSATTSPSLRIAAPPTYSFVNAIPVTFAPTPPTPVPTLVQVSKSPTTQLSTRLRPALSPSPTPTSNSTNCYVFHDHDLSDNLFGLAPLINRGFEATYSQHGVTITDPHHNCVIYGTKHSHDQVWRFYLPRRHPYTAHVVVRHEQDAELALYVSASFGSPTYATRCEQRLAQQLPRPHTQAPATKQTSLPCHCPRPHHGIPLQRALLQTPSSVPPPSEPGSPYLCRYQRSA